jgi:isoquinoline 1-oxidoreductase beta subunit
MEPLNCVADVKADSCEIWVGTQFQTVDAMTAAGITGLKPNQIKLHTTLLGGGFGRRALWMAFRRKGIKKIKPGESGMTREDDIRVAIIVQGLSAISAVMPAKLPGTKYRCYFFTKIAQ